MDGALGRNGIAIQAPSYSRMTKEQGCLVSCVPTHAHTHTLGFAVPRTAFSLRADFRS